MAQLRCGRQLRRARRPAAGARDRGLSGRAGAAARSRQGQLLRLCRPAGVLAADLSGADAGRARRARDARSRRPHALRARRRMDRAGELRRRSRACARVLRAHPQLLAEAAGRLAAAGLCRHPAEADGTGRGGGGFPDRRAARSTGCRGWCICSGSNRRASPRRSRSPKRSSSACRVDQPSAAWIISPWDRRQALRASTPARRGSGRACGAAPPAGLHGRRE